MRDVPLCRHCREESPIDLYEIWPEEQAFLLDACCEERQTDLRDDLDYASRLSPAEAHRFLRPLTEALAHYGIDLRTIYYSDSEMRWKYDYGVRIADVDFRVANQLIETHHSHSPPVLTAMWTHGAYNGDQLVAVATIEPPRARMLATRGPRTCEVTRLCVDRSLDAQLVWNACSMLYGRAAREAKQRGYDRIVTYTLTEEEGTTLRAAGWTLEHRTTGRSWNSPGRPRPDRGAKGDKYRWARYLTDAGAPAQQALFAA